ncbi:Putative peptidoglycan binding domain-containing protein [Litoreibacter janthinus]|uniref:Putative peptidoglycan binding domain-containing protein n=2 Tax=Litoreibacter janthinus TaxID=670154 RepID=A0A1I6G9H7_9RHOB|nr:Putative peptidoglycan binding domain-containing protein [Litoreibacter janthinus]
MGPTYRASACREALQFAIVLMATLLLALPLLAQDGGSGRIALIIGNGAYENVAELRNPRNDSADLAASLTAAGFQVDLHLDQDQGKMLDTLRAFRRKADRAEIALIYYAGHGIEIDRQNYLLPVDAVLETDADVNFEAVKLETMVFAASGATRLSMVVVDACRNNPFASSMKRTNASRSIGRGLSAIEPTKNTLVAYAAKEGTTAADGIGRNSPYATALIDALGQRDLEVGLMMRRVRDSVLKATAGKQEPFVYGSLSADPIYLNDTRGIAPGTTIIDTSEGRVEDVPTANAAEIVFWKSIADTTKPSLLEAYLDLYPDGFFAELANAKIELLGGATPPPQKVATAAPFETLAPVIAEDRALSRDELVELQERLSSLGHALGSADGVAGRRTKAAIREYEQAEGRPVLGLASLPVLKALRDKVSEAELKDWRARKAASVTKAKTAAPKPAKAAARPKQVTQPKVVAPKATAPPPPKVVAKKVTPKPSNKYTQFCGANRQCGTAECRSGDSGQFFKKTRNCKFCSLYSQRCR